VQRRRKRAPGQLAARSLDKIQSWSTLSYGMNTVLDKQQPAAEESRLIATFGACRIVKRADGRFDLAGGTPEDREQAQRWADTFLKPTERSKPQH